MTHTSYFSLVLPDRDAIEHLVDDFFVRGTTWRKLSRRFSFVAPDGGAHGSKLYCVQRQGRLLGDHTVEENWKLPLWELAEDDLDEWSDLLADAQEFFHRYSSFKVSHYPGQLDGVSLLAAQFSQAYIMKPDVLLLDSVLSGWYHADQAIVGQMVSDYAERYPFRPMMYVDVVPPPADVLPFIAMEMPRP